MFPGWDGRAKRNLYLKESISSRRDDYEPNSQIPLQP